MTQKHRNDPGAKGAAAALTVVTDHSTAVTDEQARGGEMGKKPTQEGLTKEELEQTNGEELPDRQAMTLIRAQPLPEPVFPIDPDPGVIPLDDPPPGT